MTTTASSTSGLTAPDQFTLEMAAYPENVYLVRNLVDQAAESWGLWEMRHTGRLILTELATNAVRRYTGAMIHLWVARPRQLIMEAGVWDPDGANMPEIREPGETSETGRGLYLIRELAEGRLGWYPSRLSGKVVWARFGGTDAD